MPGRRANDCGVQARAAVTRFKPEQAHWKPMSQIEWQLTEINHVLIDVPRCLDLRMTDAAGAVGEHAAA